MLTCEASGIRATVFIDSYVAIRWHAYRKSVHAQACSEAGKCDMSKSFEAKVSTEQRTE